MEKEGGGKVPTKKELEKGQGHIVPPVPPVSPAPAPLPVFDLNEPPPPPLPFHHCLGDEQVAPHQQEERNEAHHLGRSSYIIANSCKLHGMYNL